MVQVSLGNHRVYGSSLVTPTHSIYRSWGELSDETKACVVEGLPALNQRMGISALDSLERLMYVCNPG